GIRECGLDFLVKTADFYGVSCDYLLGRSPERTGALISYQDIPDDATVGKENIFKGSILPTLNKKIIVNSINIIYDLLQQANNNDLTIELSNFINLSIYRVFRIIYNINSKNEQNLFTVSPIVASAKSLAAMALCEANCRLLISELPQETRDKLYISTQTLQQNYPMFNSLLLNLIKNSEDTINK
ncbi:MAG: transcriptional regulator, partial [Oscillospiraceae bacterium]